MRATVKLRECPVCWRFRQLLVDEWVSTIGLHKREYGTHSMRRTKAALIYKATGNLRAVQILLGHTNIENTVRYLGVDVDDALQNAYPSQLIVVQ